MSEFEPTGILSGPELKKAIDFKAPKSEDGAETSNDQPVTPEELRAETEQIALTPEEVEEKKQGIKERLFTEAVDGLFNQLEDLSEDVENQRYLYHEGVTKDSKSLELDLGGAKLTFKPEMAKALMQAFWEARSGDGKFDAKLFGEALKAGAELLKNFNDYLENRADKEARGEKEESSTREPQVVELGLTSEQPAMPSVEGAEGAPAENQEIPTGQAGNGTRV